MNTVVWTLADGLLLLREIQAVVEPLGFHTGILGSVALKGSSKNDLDIVIYPTLVPNGREVHKGEVVVALVGLGMQQHYTVAQVHAAWRKQGSIDTKHVEKWEYRGKPVDVFFLA
jgi:hypothetical protein